MSDTAEQVACCRCDEPIVGLYFLADNGSPCHWECLTREEQDERGGELP